MDQNQLYGLCMSFFGSRMLRSIEKEYEIRYLDVRMDEMEENVPLPPNLLIPGR